MAWLNHGRGTARSMEKQQGAAQEKEPVSRAPQVAECCSPLCLHGFSTELGVASLQH